MAASAPETTDPELQATAWDLEPLVEGDGPEGVESRLADALTRSQQFAERYAGKLGELDSDGLREAMGQLAEIHDLVGRAGTYAALRFSTDTADPGQRRAAAGRPGARHGDRDDAAVLRPGVGRAGRRARRAAARRRRPGLLPPPPAQRAPLSRPPAVRARGEDPRGEVADRRRRLDAAVRGADVGDRGGQLPGDRPRPAEGRVRRRRAGRARRRAQPPLAARSRGAAHRPPRPSARRSRRACARARSCSTRCWPTRASTTGCAATRAGWPRATSPTRPATSRCRR